MNYTEITLRIIELVVTASTPVLILIFGFRLTRKREDLKNESASKYLWHTKWIDVLFQKHLAYCDNIMEFIAIWTRFKFLSETGKAESVEGQKLIEENNELCKHKLVRTSQDLKLLSINVFEQNNDIEKLLYDIYAQIHYIHEHKRMDEHANTATIFGKLIELNQATEKLIQGKFNVNGTETDHPQGNA